MTLAPYLDWLKRAAWTILYIVVAVFLSGAAAGQDITSLTVLKAIGIAAALVAVKTLLANKLEDPDRVRNVLTDIAVRAFHTFWQTVVTAVLVSGDFSWPALKVAAIAAAVNTLKGVILPPAGGTVIQGEVVLAGAHEAGVLTPGDPGDPADSIPLGAYVDDPTGGTP